MDPHDFRLWVALHEETHRVQFTAVPWLRTHLVDSARELSQGLAPDPEELGAKLQQVARNLPEALRSGGGGLTDLFATPEQRAQIGRVTAVMSLLEGHADVVMDDVGPRVIPSVAEIRAKFQQRRLGAGTVDRLLRRLLGLEAKMRQYRDGAVFVRAVTDAVGVDGFNAVWTSPQTLPLPEEIPQPDVWVRRVHGMTGPHPAVAATRVAVRAEPSATLPAGALVLVACSGGADSLALAAATAFEAPRAGLRAGARGRGPRPAGGIRATSPPARPRACRDLGLAPVRRPAGDRAGDGRGARGGRPHGPVRRPAGRRGGPRGRAGCCSGTPATTRPSRSCSASPAAPAPGPWPVCPRRRGVFARPLLGLPRVTTAQACADAGLDPWQDPHNADPAYRRVRARRLLAELERDLGPGVVPALARSADLLREDADLHRRARAARPGARWAPGSPDAAALAALPRAVRGAGLAAAGRGGGGAGRRAVRRARRRARRAGRPALARAGPGRPAGWPAGRGARVARCGSAPRVRFNRAVQA